jgi:hypothetical protein
MKNIINYNNKQQYHGYQQWHVTNILHHRANYINGNRIGYTESHSWKQTNFYII